MLAGAAIRKIRGGSPVRGVWPFTKRLR